MQYRNQDQHKCRYVNHLLALCLTFPRQIYRSNVIYSKWDRFISSPIFEPLDAKLNSQRSPLPCFILKVIPPRFNAFVSVEWRWSEEWDYFQSWKNNVCRECDRNQFGVCEDLELCFKISPLFFQFFHRDSLHINRQTKDGSATLKEISELRTLNQYCTPRSFVQATLCQPWCKNNL